MNPAEAVSLTELFAKYGPPALAAVAFMALTPIANLLVTAHIDRGKAKIAADEKRQSAEERKGILDGMSASNTLLAAALNRLSETLHAWQVQAATQHAAAMGRLESLHEKIDAHDRRSQAAINNMEGFRIRQRKFYDENENGGPQLMEGRG